MRRVHLNVCDLPLRVQNGVLSECLGLLIRADNKASGIGRRKFASLFQYGHVEAPPRLFLSDFYSCVYVMCYFYVDNVKNSPLGFEPLARDPP